MSKSGSFLAFVAGAAIGSVITWKLVKDKYEQIAQEEIDSVKDTFRNRTKETEPNSEESEDETETESGRRNKKNLEKPDIFAYASKINDMGYRNYSGISQDKADEEDEEEREEMDEPYIISPEEFGELDGYEKITLYHYSDGVLTDDDNEPVEDVTNTVGDDYVDHFGEYEDDSVFVRNDRLKCDYEILLDEDKYSDVQHTTYNGYSD